MARKLVCVALLLFLSACGSQTPSQITADTETFFPTTKTLTPIPTKTITSEPAPSLTPTKISSTTLSLTEVVAWQQNIPEGVESTQVTANGRVGLNEAGMPIARYSDEDGWTMLQVAEELGNPVRFEEKGEKWVGYDEGGKPVVQLTDGGIEWEKFERDGVVVYYNQWNAGIFNPPPVDDNAKDVEEKLNSGEFKPFDYSQAILLKTRDESGNLVELPDGRVSSLDLDAEFEDGGFVKQRGYACVYRGWYQSLFNFGENDIAVLCEAKVDEERSIFFFIEVADDGDFMMDVWKLPDGAIDDKKYAPVTASKLVEIFKGLPEGTQIAFWEQFDRDEYHNEEKCGNDGYCEAKLETSRAFLNMFEDGDIIREISGGLSIWHFHFPDWAFEQDN